MTPDDALGLLIDVGCTILCVGAAWLVLGALWAVLADLRRK